MKLDKGFNEIKIRHLMFMYLIAMGIVIIASIFVLPNSAGEISDSKVNQLTLLGGITLFSMLIYRIKPSKEKINILYKDFRSKLNIREIICVITFFSFLNIGGTKITIDMAYLISPRFVNQLISDCPLIIDSTVDYWTSFVIFVILSPIVDELTFRNVIFKRLSKKFNIYIGLIVSSILFSALNICPEMIGALALGIINCILYVKYRNILIPMFIYFINSIIYMFVSMPLEKIKIKSAVLAQNDIVSNAITGVILFTIGIIFFIRFIIKNKIYLRENIS